MPRTLCRSNKPLYLNLFPSWKGKQPLRFFMMENLLEARHGSEFPTNGAGPDEDVNVFLADLLTRFLDGRHQADLVFGAGSLLVPPDRSLGRRQRADYYLANAHHRLLHLGLLNRGDGLRRRRVPFGLEADEARLRDAGVGRECYRAAANLLDGRNLVSPAVVAVYRKLADFFEDYVHVLAVMATRRLGLGARLSSKELDSLLAGDPDAPVADCPPIPLPANHPAMDSLLDLMLEYRKDPRPSAEGRLRAAAARAGADPAEILSGLRRT
jgi:hypothetical protein